MTGMVRSINLILPFVASALASGYYSPPEDRARTSQYNLSPESRTITPVNIYTTTGNVTDLDQWQDESLTGHNFLLSGPGAAITYDFGQITGGVPTIDIQNPSCDGKACSGTNLPSFNCTPPLCQGLGLAYTESVRFVGDESDNSTLPNVVNDGTVFLPMTAGHYEIPAKWGRGAFRYITFSLGENAANSTSVELRFEELYYTAAPNIAEHDLRKYSGHFYSSDELLNRIWYAGAYTIQLCLIGANTSVNHVETLGGGWAQNSTATDLTSSDVFLADGAKRDRNPWSGDLSVAIKSTLMSQNYQNLLAVKNSLTEMIILQDPLTGYFPYAGSPLGDVLVQFGQSLGVPGYGSDTYHLWTILGYFEYVSTSDDSEFALEHWYSIIRGITATYQYIDNSTSLFNSTRTLDWGRIGQGGQSTSVNAMYHHVLVIAASFAKNMPMTADVNATKWLDMASRIKISINEILFDEPAGLFFDNTTAAGHNVHPQDGNALAILFNVTSTPERSRLVASNLASRLGPYGAPATELPGFISPFITSLELRSQFLVSQGDISTPMNLLRTQWGFMLRQFSNSTMIEGYAVNGDLSYGFSGTDYTSISHAHAWSTGPVYSLLHDVVGLQADQDSNMATTALNSSKTTHNSTTRSWVFKPGVVGSGLEHAEGSFTLHDGYYRASWKMSKSNACSAANHTVLRAEILTPQGTVGTLLLPDLRRQPNSAINVLIDGEVVCDFTNTSSSAPWVQLDNVISGGKHRITVKYPD